MAEGELLRSGAFTCSPAETASRAASQQCCAQVRAVLHPAHGTPAVVSIRGLADQLATRPLDAQLSADFTRLSVLARHTRFHAGQITNRAFAETLHALERRHWPRGP